MRYVLDSLDEAGIRTIEPSLPYAAALAEFCRRCDIEDAGTSEGDEARGLLYDGTVLILRPFDFFLDVQREDDGRIPLDPYIDATFDDERFELAFRRAAQEFEDPDFESEEFSEVYHDKHLKRIAVQAIIDDLIEIGAGRIVGVNDEGELLYDIPGLPR